MTEERDSSGSLDERSRRPSSTRDELLDAACHVIERMGGSASMQDMAAAAGITKPILYRHFGDKAGLLRALALRSVRVYEPNLADVLAMKVPLEERILIIARQFFCQVERDQALWRAMQPGSQGDALLADVSLQLCSEAAAVLEQHIQADGLPPPRSSLLAEAIVGAAFRMAWRWVREGGCSSEEIALDASRMVAGTIRAMAER